MAVIDPETYGKFRPIFLDALKTHTEPGADVAAMLRAIVKHLAEVFDRRSEAEALRPYILLFVREVQNGLIDPFAEVPHLSELESAPSPVFTPYQKDLFGEQPGEVSPAERALIEQLIAATRLYDSGEAIKELFDFTIKLREFAPFNAMLLHIQKPGLTHAATAQDWHKRFGRAPKKGARPLLILRTKGPVDFVFDVLDTEGKDLPRDAFSFPTFGKLSESRFAEFMRALKKEKINLVPLDAGDGQAGWIELVALGNNRKGKNVYEIGYNRNHSAPTRLVTVAHELAHLYLGHLGADNGRRVPDRRDTPHALMEVEAEMAAYLVAKRNGLTPMSETYLSNYKGAFEDLNLYAVTRTANAVETAMGISAQKLWNEKA